MYTLSQTLMASHSSVRALPFSLLQDTREACICSKARRFSYRTDAGGREVMKAVMSQDEYATFFNPLVSSVYMPYAKDEYSFGGLHTSSLRRDDKVALW